MENSGKKWKPKKVGTSSTTVVSCNNFTTKEKWQRQKSGRRKQKETKTEMR